MRISCIIPTCNRSDYLIEAVKSVLSQTRPPDEIIIVNNGGSCLKLPDEIAGKVKVFETIPFIGVAQARNFGACLAVGDYLAFLDDDDFWNPRYLENVAEALRGGQTCVISRFDKLVDGKVSLYKNPEGQITIKDLLFRNPGAGGPNVVISKELFFKVGGYDPKLPPSEDKAMILEVLRAGVSVKTLPDNPVIVRMHGGSRLTDAVRISEGISQFTRKYRFLMNDEQYYFNRWKIAKYRFEAGRRGYGLMKFYWAVLFRIARFWNRLKK